ncbi:MAG: metallophosphoesterase [Lachnospiraceae bacterium]|nr:metallophosphoesterase [Lachnospiraceae bacterium]
MLYLTGDTHGDWEERLSSLAFPEGKTLTKNDYVIVLGDFGIWDNSRQQKHALDWLEKKPFTTLFLDGNHENYDILDAYPVKEWHGGKVHFIRPSVIHLLRGQIFEIDGRSFFTFGGARCHDIKDGVLEAGDPRIKVWAKDTKKRFRVNHVSWWEREMPSLEEMEEGLRNLSAAGNQVDYILTHCPYSALLERMDGGCGFYRTDFLSDYLEKIEHATSYRYWFFGHMHENVMFQRERAVCLYEQIIPLEW